MTASKTAHHRGRAAEDAAVAFLERSGYRIVARNVRAAGGEIDVVAWHEQVLCFIEVKRRKGAGGTEAALFSVDKHKQARIAHAAGAYLATLERTPPCRFDVVALAEGRATLLQNAFEAPA